MERLVDVTSQVAETPHEEWFQTTYGRTISEALNRLKNPNNPSNPHASWQLFKQVSFVHKLIFPSLCFIYLLSLTETLKIMRKLI